MNKEALYAEIRKFNEQLTNPSDRSSKTYEKAYLYVDNKNAEDKASFIGFLIDKKYMKNDYKNILDLSFGSGNLTSHIVFDNNIEYEKLILNDLNDVNTNQEITDYIENAKIEQKDMLDEKEFEDDISDLVIVNPQIGGNYIDGDILRQKKEGEKEQELLDKFGGVLKNFLSNGATLLFYGKEKDFKSILPNEHFIKYKSKLIDMFVVSREYKEDLCFEKEGSSFITCKEIDSEDEVVESFDEVEIELNDYEIDKSHQKVEEKKEEDKEAKQKFSKEEFGNLNFEFRNILFKGVPGTGKSRAIDNIIRDKLKIEDKKENILRINIHSASSNADLMQGIGISSNSNGQIEYSEKQGLVYNLIKKATYHPKQPFVLVLEEIQENSLNELIGDLIYLIEDEKRANLVKLVDDKEYEYQELIEKVIKKGEKIEYVEIPYLVSSKTEYRKMILPSNLYIFCTSNYRDDKKVIEDNLLRRFEVIEIYPKKEVANNYAQEFFESLNKSILNVFTDEIHPDRFMIGHAIWKDVDNEKKFYRAFLKVVTEFKDIKEIEFRTFEEVLKDLKFPDGVDEESIKERKSYFELITLLQNKIDYGFTN